MFSVLVIRLRSLILLRVSGIVIRLRMFLLLITFLKASHSFRNRLLVICKNAYLFATMILTSVSSPFSCCSGIGRLNLMGPFIAICRPLAIQSCFRLLFLAIIQTFFLISWFSLLLLQLLRHLFYRHLKPHRQRYILIV